MAKIWIRQAVLRALDDAMTDDPSVIVMGEDIAAAGGPFKVTEGLLATHGPERVIDTPISEMAFMGAAVGAAVCGLKPVVEMMFIEFIGVALDQLTTQAATMRYLSRGRGGPPPGRGAGPPGRARGVGAPDREGGPRVARAPR
ncbi:hypothetical protein NKH71_11195, partial [Mesorhizobium sp. M0983]